MSDCCPADGLTPIEQAMEMLLAQVKPVRETERVSLNQALGRVLATDVVSDINVPAFDNSAMDGYALRLDDLSDSEVTLPISQHIAAGHAALPLAAGTAARIFTGSIMPANADVVVMQEQTRATDTEVTLPAKDNVTAGQNIRLAGQDIAGGHKVFGIGRKLKPQDLGLLASVGVAEVEVFKRVKVAILSTGDELAEPGQPLAENQIYNSNRYTLIGLLQNEGYDILDLGTVEDCEAAVKSAFLNASAQADVVITSGGVSVGDHDHVKQVVTEIGQINFWKLAIKPGKPLAFGFIGDTPFIGLPGNPAAVFVTYLLVAKYLLLKRQNAEVEEAVSYQVAASFSRNKPNKRQEYFRVQVQKDEAGNAVLVPYSTQSSGVLASTSWAHGLAIIPRNSTVEKGEPLSFIAY